MALINCPDCNNEISDKASACPHCGLPMKPNFTEKIYTLLKWVVIISVISGAIFGVWYYNYLKELDLQNTMDRLLYR